MGQPTEELLAWEREEHRKLRVKNRKLLQRADEILSRNQKIDSEQNHKDRMIAALQAEVAEHKNTIQYLKNEVEDLNRHLYGPKETTP